MPLFQQPKFVSNSWPKIVFKTKITFAVRYGLGPTFPLHINSYNLRTDHSSSLVTSIHPFSMGLLHLNWHKAHPNLFYSDDVFLIELILDPKPKRSKSAILG